MEFVEKNSFNVRSAIYTLSNNHSPIKFIIFPMVHVGTKQYYDEIRSRLNRCDVIIYEGIKSIFTDYITWTYKIIGKINRFNLVTQEYLDIRSFKDKLIHGDVSELEFNKSWSRIPLSFRLKLLLTVPFYVIFVYFFATKSFIARKLHTEDLLSRDEILNRNDESENYYKAILDDRDDKVIDKISEYYSIHQMDEATIGIVYGAKHMRAIAHLLFTKLGFKVKNSEWITIFDLV